MRLPTLQASSSVQQFVQQFVPPSVQPLVPARRRLLQGMAHSVVLAACCPAAGLAAQGVAAVSDKPLRLEGQRFERQLRLFGADLQLNGAGVRAVAWFKGFVAGLYLQQPASTAAAVVAQPGPKRVQLRMLHEVPAQELSKALDKGMRRNTPAEQHAGLAPRLARLVALIDAAGRVRKGDVIDLDLDPQQGLMLSVNGQMQGEAIPGADFYAALLLSFVGERPYDKRLKAELLGG